MENVAKAIDFENYFSINDEERMTSYIDGKGKTRYIVKDSGRTINLSEDELDQRLKKQREKLAGYIIDIDGRGENPFSRNIGRNLGFILDSGINIDSSTKPVKSLVRGANISYGYDSKITNMDTILDLENQRRNASKMYTILGENKENQIDANNSNNQEFEIIDDFEPFTIVEDNIKIVDLNAYIEHRTKKESKESDIQSFGDIDDEETKIDSINYYIQEKATVIDDLEGCYDFSENSNVKLNYSEEQMAIIDDTNDIEVIDLENLIKNQKKSFMDKMISYNKGISIKMSNNLFSNIKSKLNKFKSKSSTKNNKVTSMEKNKRKIQMPNKLLSNIRGVFNILKGGFESSVKNNAVRLDKSKKSIKLKESFIKGLRKHGVNSKNDGTKLSLKRGLVTVGTVLAVGVASFCAFKNAPKFHKSLDNKITMESNDNAFGYLTSYINTLSNELKAGMEQQFGVEKQMTSIETNDDKESTIKFGDDIQLNNDIQLNYNSMGEGPSVRIDKLDCASFNINRIAVLSEDGEEVISNKKITNKDKQEDVEKFTNKCKSKYGNNIKFAINVDVLTNNGEVYEDAGWTSLDNINTAKNKGHSMTLKR